MTKYMATRYSQDDVEAIKFNDSKELLNYLRENGVKTLPFLLEDLGDESMEVKLSDGTIIEIEEMAYSVEDHTELIFEGNSYISIKDYATEHNCSTRKVRYAIDRRYLKYIKFETFAHKTVTLVDRNGSTNRRPSPVS